MFNKPEFYGSATVGERGQIVLPAKMRKKFNIKAGEKLLVIGNVEMGGVMLMKSDIMNKFLIMIGKGIKQMNDFIKSTNKK